METRWGSGYRPPQEMFVIVGVLVPNGNIDVSRSLSEISCQ